MSHQGNRVCARNLLVPSPGTPGGEGELQWGLFSILACPHPEALQLPEGGRQRQMRSSWSDRCNGVKRNRAGLSPNPPGSFFSQLRAGLRPAGHRRAVRDAGRASATGSGAAAGAAAAGAGRGGCRGLRHSRNRRRSPRRTRRPTPRSRQLLYTSGSSVSVLAPKSRS